MDNLPNTEDFKPEDYEVLPNDIKLLFATVGPLILMFLAIYAGIKSQELHRLINYNFDNSRIIGAQDMPFSDYESGLLFPEP